MNDSEGTQGRAQTTEQIAIAGAGNEADTSSGQPLRNARTQQPVLAERGAAGGDLGVGDQPHAPLLEDQELQSIHVRWKDIQAEFVDEPRRAVQDADALVAELMQRLAQMFASEREQLESRWAGGDDVSTEELRHGLRRYRSFFERLLAA
jgi:hypothetical protein